MVVYLFSRMSGRGCHPPFHPFFSTEKREKGGVGGGGVVIKIIEFNAICDSSKLDHSFDLYLYCRVLVCWNHMDVFSSKMWI